MRKQQGSVMLGVLVLLTILMAATAGQYEEPPEHVTLEVPSEQN